ncbi:hypothetical protein FQN55_005121 [Onygenales sp. PD_40]|nr:hypothetical protein FQN55_005121 [Onygenales sp. PD_40]
MAAKVARVGITVLYEPQGEEPNLDIVFVHGLFGHPKNTWTCNTFKDGDQIRSVDPDNDDDRAQPPRKKARTGQRIFSEVYWPRDLLPTAMPRSRILTWGYDASADRLFASTSHASVFQHAETLLFDLATLRRAQNEKTRPIIFVAHSLGGIVVKDALSLSKNEKNFYKEILPASAGVCFLGTPHRGSKVASIGKIAFEVSKLFLRDPNLKLLRALEINSEILERVSKSFCQILSDGNLHVHSFSEELSTTGLKIVDSFSSYIGEVNETRGIIYADHRNIARFSGLDDPGFKRVQNVLLKWESDISRRNVAEPYCFTSSTRAAVVDRLMSNELRQSCLQALNNPETRYRLHSVEKTFGGTCNWLFKRTVGFEDWLSGKTKSSIYWIQGKPGSGKSTAMKFALRHQLTLDLLKEHDRSPWVVAGFFFHDRGSAIQKSIEGLVFELLFQILSQRQDLIDLVLRVYPEELQFIPPSLASNPASTSSTSMTWTLHDAKEAMLLILSQQRIKVNIALFIDALDENTGDHRELLDLLGRLRNHANESNNVRLRLCLASRPENVFRLAFAQVPGFAIHDMTREDIREYTAQRIQAESFNSSEAETTTSLQPLVDEIISKAEGVFIWVKLVVDELVEGLCEGDSIEELRGILSTIPSELKDLYHRALRRSTRYPTETRAKYSNEAYVMFQIVLCSHTPCRIQDFLRKTNSIMAGKILDIPVDFSVAQAKRRLHSRSAGLLEIVRSDDTVQFIHQTVKDFMTDDIGRSTIREGVDDVLQKSGHILMVEYYIRLAIKGEVAFSPSRVECIRQWGWSESNEGKPLIHYIEKFIAEQAGGNKLNDIFALLFGENWFPWELLENKDTQLYFLVHSIIMRLELSVQANLLTHAELAKANGGALLLASYIAINLGISSVESILKMLLRAGIDVDTNIGRSPDRITLLASRVIDFLAGYRYLDLVFRFLLKEGADPNQKVASPVGQWPLVVVAAGASDLRRKRPIVPDDPEALLLSAGADPMTEDSFGCTALFYSICTGYSAWAKLLIQYGADPRRLNSKGLDAFNPRREQYVKPAIYHPPPFTLFIIEKYSPPKPELFEYDNFVSACNDMKDILVKKKDDDGSQPTDG